MRRWLLKDGVSDLEGLVMETVPMPEPGPGEVRIRIHAVSLNFRDQLVIQQGAFWRVPGKDIVPVADGSGEIDALGAGVSDFVVGDRVVELYFRDFFDGPPHTDMGIGLGATEENGMLAEYVVLPAKRVMRAPASLSYEQASTIPCAGLTAWSALYGDHPIGSDSKVLVLGTGGVSLFALLFARAAGAQVFATTGQEQKRKRLLELGANEVFNYREIPEWGKAVFERTGGVDKVVESAGSLNQSLAAVRPGGEVAIMGFMTSDGPPSPPLLMGKGAIIRGVAVGNARAYSAMSKAIDASKIQPPIDRYFSFEDAKEAYRAQASPELFGKVVINVT